MTEPRTILFRERQHFRQVWLWVIILTVAALFWAGFIYQVGWGFSSGNRWLGAAGAFLLVILMGIGFPYFFYRTALTTTVEPGLLQLRFWPFHVKAVEIELHLVRDFEQVIYNPILEYGGWGIRWGIRGKAYNVSGNTGVQLYFYNRKPILIGSQEPKQLYEAIMKAKQVRQE